MSRGDTTSKTQFAVTSDPHKSVIQVSLGSQLQLSLGSQVVLPLTPLTIDTTMLLLTSVLQAVCLHDNENTPSWCRNEITFW